MTIHLSDLTDGTWYDGFIWHKGSQKGTTTLRWSESLQLFFNPQLDLAAHYPHVDDANHRDWSALTFEPNTISIGEPAA